MSAARRISITVYSAVVLAFLAVGLERTGGIGDPNAWLLGFVFASALAVVGVSFVYRWWALLPAVTTVTAFWCGDGVIRFEEFLESEFAGPLLLLPTLIGIGVLSVGLIARAIWEYLVRPNLSSRPDSKEAIR